MLLVACKEAYTGNDMQSACAFGCQAQIPNIEGHHKHVRYNFTVLKKNELQFQSAICNYFKGVKMEFFYQFITMSWYLLKCG